MDEGRSRWLVGVRRSWTLGALDAWVEEGITGVIWSPDAWIPADAADAIGNLVADGATPDRALLWDLAVRDLRAAAESLEDVYEDSGGSDGYVAVWLDPDHLLDPGRAVQAARTTYNDVWVPNLAVAFAWHPARSGSLSAIVAKEVAVALTGVSSPEAAAAVSEARRKGIERLHRDRSEGDEESDEVPVFLLGSSVEGQDGTPAVVLADEFELADVPVPAPVLPADADAEREAFDRAAARVASLAARTPHEDAHAPDGFVAEVRRVCRSLNGAAVPRRMWARDHTLWAPDPEEITDRLDWLDVAVRMRAEADELAAFGASLRSEGVSRVILLGMGGSSLAPETFRSVVGGALPLTVLDTTHPDRVRSVTADLDPARTAVVVSSKSGTTAETRSQLEHLWAWSGRADRFVVVTDPGTPLGDLARERGFRRVFENPPDIGGRYSGLSYFGLVPAALCGIDVTDLLDGAVAMIRRSAPSVPAHVAPGTRLGAALIAAADAGRTALTLILPPRLASLGDWIEQLVAESTGKQGRGILPVVGEDLGPPEVYREDRLFVAYALGDEAFPEGLGALTEADHPVVRIRIGDRIDVGAEMYRWMVATAVAGFGLDVHPFDQPDVESTKARTRALLDGDRAPELDRGDASALMSRLAEEPEGRYVALQAFLAPTDEHARRLQAVRLRLRDAHHVPTTLGFGPRFLHSTGQLHKGGPPGGVFLQVIGPHDQDLEIPGVPHTFGRLFDAQADGDLHALRDAGRDVARVSLDELEALR